VSHPSSGITDRGKDSFAVDTRPCSLDVLCSCVYYSTKAEQFVGFMAVSNHGLADLFNARWHAKTYFLCHSEGKRATATGWIVVKLRILGLY